MRINNVKFCFAHLQSCHNGWACNILIVVDTGLEGGQNKTSHRLFSKYYNRPYPETKKILARAHVFRGWFTVNYKYWYANSRILILLYILCWHAMSDQGLSNRVLSITLEKGRVYANPSILTLLYCFGMPYNHDNYVGSVYAEHVNTILRAFSGGRKR